MRRYISRFIIFVQINCIFFFCNIIRTSRYSKSFTTSLAHKLGVQEHAFFAVLLKLSNFVARCNNAKIPMPLWLKLLILKRVKYEQHGGSSLMERSGEKNFKRKLHIFLRQHGEKLNEKSLIYIYEWNVSLLLFWEI